MVQGKDDAPFDPGNFPALLEFLPAYLHQDFAAEYDSPGDALKAFLSEASGDEIRDVKEEWVHLRKRFAGKPLGEIQRGLEQLGSAWSPENEEQLKSIDEILARPEA